MRTPELSDYEGNVPDKSSLTRLARYPSLSERGLLRSLPEDVLRPGEDARLIFIRGTFYRRDAIAEVVDRTTCFAFELVAEPENAADPFAIAILLNGEKAGYVPREIAPDVQPLVEAGRCRIAARGPIAREGDSFNVAVLLAWTKETAALASD